MCHITYLNEIDKDSLKEFFSIFKEKSRTNSDGFGLFNNENTIYKRCDGFSKKHRKELIRIYKKSGFLIGHNRLATDGDVKKRNSHPFESKNFIYLHNGIIRNFKEINEHLLVDSESFGFLLEKEFMKNGDIIKSIQNTTKKLKGYFSIFVYVKKSKELYYIRHNAKFEFYKVKHGEKNYIFGFTDETLRNNLFTFSKGRKTIYEHKELEHIPICDDTIYKINKKSIKEVAEFKALEEVYYFYDWSGWRSNNTKKKSGFFQKDKIKDSDVMKNEIISLIYEYTGEVVEIENNKEDKSDTFSMLCDDRIHEIIQSFGLDTERLYLEDLTELKELLGDKIYEKVYKEQLDTGVIEYEN